MLKPARSAAGTVDGTVFAVSTGDLVAADEYEVDDYVRVRVPLRSGRTAWVYVIAEGDGPAEGSAG